VNALGVRLLALVLACVLASCAGGASRGGPAEQTAYAAALRVASDDPRAGAEALSGFLTTYPRSPLADDAALLLADLAVRLGKPAAAERQLEWVLREHQNGDRADRARLTLAKLQRARGAAASARSTALRIRLANLTPPEQREARRLLADLAAEAKDPTDRLRWLGELAGDPEPGAGDEAVDDEIDDVIAALPDDVLDPMAEALGRRPIAARLRLVQAERAIQSGDRRAAERALAFAKRLPLAPGDADRLVRLEARQTAKPDDRVLALVSTPRPFGDVPADPFVSTGGLGTTLGVVLPLSGSVAGYAADALAGIQLAAGVSEGEPSHRQGPRLVVRDSGGAPGAAADAVRELAADPRVLAIIGPLLPEEAEAAAQAATESGVPLLSLSRREGLAVGKPGVLRVGTSPRLEAELLAEHAIREAGQSRFAILYPEDAFGRALRAAFWDAVEARGGEVVAVGRYPVGASDFAGPIRRMIGFELLPPGAPQVLAERERMLKRAKRLPAQEAKELREKAAELTAPDGEPLPPYVDFEAVFIPDTYQAAGLLAPHLAFHEVRGVSLLGPSAWNHPELLELGGRHLDGAVFPAAYHAAVSAPHVVAFGERYEASYQRAPSSLAAEAFDATNLVLAAAAAGVEDRDGLIEALFREPRRAGVSGALEIGPDGEVARRPHLLGVSRGVVVSLDEAPPLVDEGDADVFGAPPASD
jgi:ABC-type branched-subunit amino acid transport system substrate-binding protein